jgi:hypothetical protein
VLLEPTYHGNLTSDLVILMLAVFKVLWMTGTGFAALVIVGFEFYLRHETKIKRLGSTFRGFVARALGWVPYPKFSPVSMVSVRKAKARKAVA